LDKYSSQPRLALLMMVEHWDNGRPEQGNWVGTELDISMIFGTMEQRNEYQQKIMELMKSA